MPKRILQGTVVSNKNEKTIVVKVERTIKHPLYRKVIRKHKKYMAHSEENNCELGNIVRIQECIPISKNKKWKLVEILK